MIELSKQLMHCWRNCCSLQHWLQAPQTWPITMHTLKSRAASNCIGVWLWKILAPHLGWDGSCGCMRSPLQPHFAFSQLPSMIWKSHQLEGCPDGQLRTCCIHRCSRDCKRLNPHLSTWHEIITEPHLSCCRHSPHGNTDGNNGSAYKPETFSKNS